MEPKPVINEIKRAVQEVFEEYKERGLISIYLWGSVISPDFDPKTSDIDSIGFSEDRLPFELEEEIKNELHNHFPDIEKFGFRIVYMDEMAGGPLKSQVSKWIPPQILLWDFPSWIHAAGKELLESDFGLKRGPSKEVARAHVNNDSYHHRIDSLNEADNLQFVKSTARLLDIVEGKRKPTEPFSYSKLLANAETAEEKEMTNVILESKRSKYDLKVFEKNKEIYRKFWSAVESLIA